MTKEEMIKKLKEINPIAYPTVMTCDIGCEFEILTSDGIFSGCYKFSYWPIYALFIDDNVRSLAKRAKQNKAISENMLCKTLFLDVWQKEQVSDDLFCKEDIKEIKKVLKEVEEDTPYIYIFKQPYTDVMLSLKKEDVVNAFLDANLGDVTTWEELNEDNILYAYGQAEVYDWGGMPEYRIGKGRDEEKTAEEDDDSADDLPDIGSDNQDKADRLLQKAKGAVNPEYANSLLEEAVRYENAEAMEMLASNIADGIGAPREIDRAIALWEWSAKLGNAKAQYNVCIAYARGQMPGGTDYSKAFDWCMKSAEQGCARAIANIGQFYLYGHGVEENEALAFEWLKRGVDAGADGIFLYLLGYCYESGIGTAVDLDAALKLYNKVTEIPYAKDGIERIQSKYH